MPKYWMISDRSDGGVTYWVSDKPPLTGIKNWRKVTETHFEKLLAAAADKFPAYDPAENEKQSHVTILVHGFNNKFASATKFYQDLCGRLFDDPDSLGLCILYDWPSRGSILGYEPDRLLQLFSAGSRWRGNSRSLFRKRRHNQFDAPRPTRPRPRCT